MPVFVPLIGSKRALLPSSRAAGPVNLSEIASLTIRVRSVGDLAQLIAGAHELGRQPVAERRYLTHAELAQQYGASAEDLDDVEHVAARHNLVVVRRSALERTVVVRGRMRDLLSVFRANVHMYHHATGTYRGRQGAIEIPQRLDSIVTGVFGFDTRPRRRTRYPLIAQLGGPGGGNGVMATEFARRYRFPTEIGGVNLDGRGQTVAIIELGGGYRNGDLATFFSEAKMAMPQVTAVAVDRGRNSPTEADSADSEVMLDIEVAGAVAPGARFAVYFAPNDDQGFLQAISAAVHDTERKPGVISISWGSPEGVADPQGLQAYHEIFAAAAQLGITVCVAAGDHGCADLDAASWDGKVHVDHPACDDLVLGCGGTQIVGDRDAVWNDGTPFDASAQGGGGWTTGGGISQVFAVPAYQAQLAMPAALADGKPGRGVPDIAMSATNYFTRVDGYEGAAGGTSAVAPLAAALVALLGQAKGKPIGFINPLLYANPGALTDVTDGTNAIERGAPGYRAAVGWDPCTGLGTPDGTALLAKL